MPESLSTATALDLISYLHKGDPGRADVVRCAHFALVSDAYGVVVDVDKRICDGKTLKGSIDPRPGAVRRSCRVTSCSAALGVAVLG